MKKNNLLRFVQSLVLLPAMTMSFSTANVQSGQSAEARPSVLVQKVNIASFGTLSFNQEVESKEELAAKALLQAKADAIDAYFAKYDMPLAGTGLKMVEEAEKNDLDWRLLAAIAVRESTGGKHDCVKVDNNPFGWGSCKVGFKSVEEAIETIARNLGGNNPTTAYHYDNKTTAQILRAYNPPSIIPKYVPQVISIMNKIGPEDLIPMDMVTT